MKFLTYFFVLVLSLTAAVEAGGNPFKEEASGDLLSIKRRSVAQGPHGVRELFRRRSNNPKE